MIISNDFCEKKMTRFTNQEEGSRFKKKTLKHFQQETLWMQARRYFKNKYFLWRDLRDRKIAGKKPQNNLHGHLIHRYFVCCNLDILERNAALFLSKLFLSKIIFRLKLFSKLSFLRKRIDFKAISVIKFGFRDTMD